MKIKFLGTGSAFTLKNYQTNLLLDDGNYKLLFDCGSDIRFSLAQRKMSYDDIDAVYISHRHADHCGGLEYLAFCSFFNPQKQQIKLFGNRNLLQDLWQNTLKGGLRSVQGKQMQLEDYFDVINIQDNGYFVYGDYKYQTVQAVHIMSGYMIVPTLGLMVQRFCLGKEKGKKLYITGDTQFNPNQIMDFYKGADIIIQDCQTASYRSGVHAHYDQLKTLPNDIKRKMYLVHYMDNMFELNRDQWDTKIVGGGFAGMPVPGEQISV